MNMYGAEEGKKMKVWRGKPSVDGIERVELFDSIDHGVEARN